MMYFYRKNKLLCREECLPKLETFYDSCVLPEIVAPSFPIGLPRLDLRLLYIVHTYVGYIVVLTGNIVDNNSFILEHSSQLNSTHS